MLTYPQGLPAPLVGAMAETAAVFVTYSAFQNVIRSFSPPSERSHPLSIPQLGLASAGAGFVTSFVLYVLQTLPLGLQSSDRYS